MYNVAQCIRVGIDHCAVNLLCLNSLPLKVTRFGRNATKEKETTERNESFANFKLKVTYIRFEIPSHRK